MRIVFILSPWIIPRSIDATVESHSKIYGVVGTWTCMASSLTLIYGQIAFYKTVHAWMNPLLSVMSMPVSLVSSAHLYLRLLSVYLFPSLALVVVRCLFVS